MTASAAVPIKVKKREKTGGRKAGTPNKRTTERRAAIAAIQASGKDPVTFFADILKNEAAPLELRFQAARELAPYMHPKLASIEARNGGQTHEERLARAHAMLLEENEEKPLGPIPHPQGGC